METNNEHSPLPWSAAGEHAFDKCEIHYNEWSPYKKINVAYAYNYADAAYIVRCVNAHDKLVEALRKVAESHMTGCELIECDKRSSIVNCFECQHGSVNIAKSALAAAGEEVAK